MREQQLHTDMHTAVPIYDAKAVSPPAAPQKSMDAHRRKGLWTVLSVQAWGDFIVGILAAVGLIIISCVATPHERQIFINDPTIAFTDAGGEGVPDWVCVIVPIPLLLISAAIVELIVNRRDRSRTLRFASLLHCVLQGLVAFALGMLVCDILKYMVGYPRPQFLARCKPTQTTFPTSLNTNAINTVTCTQTDTSYLDDGRKSFPSGHSTSTSSMSAFIIAYIVIAVYARQRPMISPGSSRVHNFLKDVGHAILLIWCALVFFFPWYIAATRVIDYMHSTADVTAGLLLGFLVGGMMGQRAVLRARVIVEALTL